MIFAATAAFVSMYSCSADASAGPELWSPGVHVIAGDVSDTVGAQPTQALVVTVRDSAGALLTGRVVRFESLEAYTSAPYVIVEELSQNNFSYFASDTTTAAGQAAVLVAMGIRAGPAKLQVSVPEAGIVDTIVFDVAPGNATRVRLTPHDTVALVNGSIPLAAKVVDRWSNPRAEAASVSSLTPSTCSASSTQVTGLAIGACRVEASYDALRDTLRAAVLPLARLAVVRMHQSLGLVNTDGSGYREIMPIFDASLAPNWSPDATRLVIYEHDPYAAVLTVVDTMGVRLASLGQDTIMTTATTGAFSPDGAWVYFSGRKVGGARQSIWRAYPDFTHLQQMLRVSTSFTFSTALRPRVSADGQTVVFDVDGKIGMLDVTTHTPTILNVQGVAPALSPDGQSIAFIAMPGTHLAVMNRDGSNVRILSSDGFYEWQSPQWTADGLWIMAQRSYGQPVLISPTTLEVLVLNSVPGYGQVVMQPPAAR